MDEHVNRASSASDDHSRAVRDENVERIAVDD